MYSGSAAVSQNNTSALAASMDAMESVPLDSVYENDTRRSSSLVNAHPLASHDAADEASAVPSARLSSNDRIRGDLFLETASPDVTTFPYPGGMNASNGGSKDYSTSLPCSSSSSSFCEYLNITVSQPQKVQESAGTLIVPGSNTYVTYLIVTQTNIPKYGGHDFAVRRRFRDVVALADRLAQIYRGYFIPARPDKNIVESQVMQKQEFIEQRRAAIQKYLSKLANHPVIRMSDELRSFLQSQGKLPLIPTTDIASRMLDGAASLPRQLFWEQSMVMTPEDVTQPAKGGKDLVRMFKELKQSVTNDWGGLKPAVNEEDKEFSDKKAKLDALENRLIEASKHAEALIDAQQEVGEATGELGLAFIKLAKFESEEAALNVQSNLVTDTKQLATAALKAGRLYREANAQSVKHLDYLHEVMALMQSIHTAFNDRSTALLTVQTLMTEISSLNAKIEKLKIASSKVFGGDKTRNHKIEELREALATTESSRVAATREYERIKEINKSELDHFNSEREQAYLEMIRGFVHSQVEYSNRIATTWSKVTEEFEIAERLPSSPVLVIPRP